MLCFALLLSGCCLLMLMQQQTIPVFAFAEEGRATVAPSQENRPIIQFEHTMVTIKENESFIVPVIAENWVKGFQGDIKVQITVSDPNLDIVNTKIPSARGTLANMRKSGQIVFRRGNGARYLTIAKEFTQERSFYIRNKVSSTPLCIGGYYISDKTGDRMVTITLEDSKAGEGSYLVGANRTLTIILEDVDGQRPDSASWSSKEECVAASVPWLKDKYRNGTHWNHFIGNANDPDCVTTVACQNGKHLQIGEVNESMTLGSTICSASSYQSGYIFVEGEAPYLYLDEEEHADMQCVGYAATIAIHIFGSSPQDGENWAHYTSCRQWGMLMAGDYVRIEGHSFFVTQVEGPRVTVTECNFSTDPCVIVWDGTYILDGQQEYVTRVMEEEYAVSKTKRIEEVIRYMP